MIPEELRELRQWVVWRFEERDGKRTKIKSGAAILVPAGARHNVINTGDKPMKLYTLYGPPEHRDRVVRATKARAEATEEHFDGKTTEKASASKVESKEA